MPPILARGATEDEDYLYKIHTTPGEKIRVHVLVTAGHSTTFTDQDLSLKSELRPQGAGEMHEEGQGSEPHQQMCKTAKILSTKWHFFHVPDILLFLIWFFYKLSK